MRAVDTNVVIRLVVGDDPQQTTLAEAFAAQGVWISTLVLAEVILVLATGYGQKPSELASAIEMLVRSKGLIIQDHEAVVKALDLFRSKPSLGFSDCLILELARGAGHLPLGTFDRDLARVEGAQRLS